MTIKLRAVAILCTLLVGALRPTRGDDCSNLLKDGIFDTRSSLNIQDRARSYANWFCSLNFSEASQADSFGGELSFPFKGIPVKFGFNSANQNFSQWYSSFCKDVHESFTEHTMVEEHVRTASKDILQAFTKCTTSDGFHVWLEYGAATQVKKFTLAATFRSPNPEKIPYATISNFVADAVKCVPDPQGVQVRRPTQRFSCTRSTNEEVRIALSSNDYDPDGAGELVLPAFQKPMSRPSEGLVVTAKAVPLDFSPQPSGGPRPGCACGSREMSFPNGPYNVNANEEFTFRYDASKVCVGQGFDNFFGIALWGSSYTLFPLDYKQYPGIAGTLKVKFSKPGTYNVVTEMALECLDVSCRNVCRARGSTQVTVN